MESCLYEGVLHHERLTPVQHRFQYRLGLAYLDLDEIPALVKAGLISTSRFGVASFRRSDHVGDSSRSIAEHVREVVENETGSRPTGPIRLLTQLSCLGYCFSPLNLFHCFGSDGKSVETVVAEVQNTPWLERHAYVLWAGNRETGPGEGGYRHPKTFHVSPFMGMNIEYRWRLRQPGQTVQVGIENLIEDAPVFRAALQLRRVAWTRATRGRLLLRFPLAPFRITAAIYWQAFQLWRKRCPFHSHPRPTDPNSMASTSPIALDRPGCNEPVATASCDA